MRAALILLSIAGLAGCADEPHLSFVNINCAPGGEQAQLSITIKKGDLETLDATDRNCLVTTIQTATD